MSEKVTDLIQKRQEKRDKNGWTLDEIKERAASDLKKYRKASSENKEPDGFHSGDMNKILEGTDDEDDKED
jgi:hypothetical protein